MYTGMRLPYPSRLCSRIWLPEDSAFSPHLMGNSSRLRVIYALNDFLITRFSHG